MGRPGISRDDVIEAAEALATEGTTPTVVGVRMRLGGGSPNNITKWLGEWKAQHEGRRPEALPALPEPVEGAMRQIWGMAWKAAQEQLEGEREALATAREGIERERAEMLAEISRLDTALDEAQGETRQASEALEAERRTHDQTRAEVRETKAIAAERERRIEEQGRELSEVRRRGEEVSAKASRLEAEVEHLRRALEAAEAKARREADARSEVTRQAEGLERELAEASGKVQALETEVEQHKQTIEIARSHALEDAETKAGLNRDLDQARAGQERAIAEGESLKRQLAEEKRIIDTSGKKIARLETSLEEARLAQTAAEQATAELRVQVATLDERAAHVDELRAMLAQLQKAAPGASDRT